MYTKKLPVGVSDFKDMVTGDYYYVDKTLFIKEIMDKGDKMAKKIHMPQKLTVWIEARKRYRLSHAHIQMARELGKIWGQVRYKSRL